MNENASFPHEAPEKNLRDYLQILGRRWRVAAWVAVGVLAVAAGVALVWPATYRSTATILIEQQEIPQDLVRSTITSFADQRIEQISARVMTSTNLLDIVREHGLYARDFDRKPREEIIERMRDDISREMISADVVDPRSGRPVEATIAFTVGFDSPSPVLAVQVANELTTLFLDENSESRRELAAESTEFFTNETERIAGQIAVVESELAEFKQVNVNMLPELAELNLQLVSRAESDLAEANRGRSLLEERRIYLQSELAQLSPSRDVVGSDGALVLDPEDRLQSLRAQRASMLGVRTAIHPGVERLDNSIAALEAELGVKAEGVSVIDELREQLAVARSERDVLLESKSSLSSEVVRQGRRIAALEDEIAAEEVRLAALPAEPPVDEDADNPVYIQLRAQLTTTEMEIAALTGEEAELEARLAELESRLAQAPIIERDYYAMTRELEGLRIKYQEMSFNARGAETAEILEMDAKGERFTLLEPALPPQRPVSPNRWIIMLLGVVGSLGAALSTIALLEALDSSVRGPVDLKALTAIMPLGVIPRIVTSEDRKIQRRRRLQFAGVTVACLILLIAAAHFLYMPIDDLWYRALRRFGV